MNQFLKPFYDYELCPDVNELFNHRLLIESAQAELREIKEKLDAELIRRMKEDNIKEFNTLLNGQQAKIYYAKNDKEKIINPERLYKYLTEGQPEEQALAARCLSYAASAWKVAKVKELCDTLGIEQKEIIQKTEGDKIEVKILPVEMLKNKGVL
jgi:hypothetical protein